MKKILIPIILISLAASAQPNKGIDSATMRDGKTLLNWKSGVPTVRGTVIFPQSSTTNTINYVLTPNIFPPSGSYISQTSGNAIQSLGIWNLFIGDNAGDSCNGCGRNIFFGPHAGISTTTGLDNFFAGWDAGYHNKNGSENIAICQDALYWNVGGRDNVAMGRGSQYSHKSPSYNINIGYNTSYYQESGIENTFVGSYSGGFIKRGYYNTGIGAYALEVNDTSKIVNNSTAIGYSAGISSPFSNATMLGANTDVTGDNQFNYDNTIRGYNRGMPNARVEVLGELRSKSIQINQSSPSVLAPGQIAVDDNYIYVGTSTGIKKVALGDVFSNTARGPEKQKRFVGYLPNGQMILVAEIK